MRDHDAGRQVCGRLHFYPQSQGALTETPAWSPDGRCLALSRTAGGVADIWVVEVETGVLRQVTQGAGARWPVWIGGEP